MKNISLFIFLISINTFVFTQDPYKQFELDIMKAFGMNPNQAMLDSIFDEKSEIIKNEHVYVKNASYHIFVSEEGYFVLILVLGIIILFIFYHWLAALTHLIVCLILLSKVKIMDKKTDQGLEIIKEVLGFKMFVEKAEKFKIEQMLKDDPAYFEKTIAYAFAFGLADKWAKKFENLTKLPKWSTDRDSTRNNFSNLQSSLHKATVHFTKSSSKSPSSSSSSSFGGGSSSGGFGRGGGGSW